MALPRSARGGSPAGARARGAEPPGRRQTGASGPAPGDHGGIDRYAAPGVSWLSCARRDAVALHALFTDTLGAGARLLTDEEATIEAIRAELADLGAADQDDVVVLFFSGHGAPSHHLVPHDTTPLDVEGTGLALDELTERFAAIPARRLICILDCCFSGGMGAKWAAARSACQSTR